LRRLRQIFVPREQEFFDLFEEAAGNIGRAAELLERMLRTYPEHGELARDILICEQEGDRITHDIIRRLNETSVTPIDRQDIYRLASALDDVVDYIEEVADFLGLYKVEAPMDQAQAMSRVLLDSSRQVEQAMPRMRNLGDIHHFTIEINRLENEGDRLMREALAALFQEGIDPMVVIRWKDIYDRLEAAIDSTETVANILENIVIKSS
jgi:predicted phosphate transport protein (TIGR00153 family)